MPCTVKMGSMDQLYEQALTTMERFDGRLAKRVPPPQLVKHRGVGEVEQVGAWSHGLHRG